MWSSVAVREPLFVRDEERNRPTTRAGERESSCLSADLCMDSSLQKITLVPFINESCHVCGPVGDSSHFVSLFTPP